MSPGTETLAVGNPSSRPRASPWATTPRTSWGRPSRAVAWASSPVTSAWRIAVDDAFSPSPAATPSMSTNGRPSTSKPSSAPIARRRATLPRRWWPKWKSSPTITTRAARQSTRTSRTNSSAGSLERASSKATTRQRSRPVAASSSSFCSTSVSSRGADSGRTTEAGWRSKVTTAVSIPPAAARARTAAMTAWWPRCTPS